MQYCSLQHQTLLPSPVTSIIGCCFCFDSISSFFLELFLHWSPVAYCTCGVHLSVSYLFVFHTVHGILKARMLNWFAISFSSEPHFVRTLHHDSSVLGGLTQHGLQFHWVRQGCGLCDKFGSFSVIVVLILLALWWIRIRSLWKLPDGTEWLRGKLGLVLTGGLWAHGLPWWLRG